MGFIERELDEPSKIVRPFFRLWSHDVRAGSARIDDDCAGQQVPVADVGTQMGRQFGEVLTPIFLIVRYRQPNDTGVLLISKNENFLIIQYGLNRSLRFVESHVENVPGGVKPRVRLTA